MADDVIDAEKYEESTPKEDQIASNIGTVMVAGSGVLGSQIAMQCAVFGHDVHLYDINDEALKKGMNAIRSYVDNYVYALDKDKSEVLAAVDRISTFTDIAEAAKGVDLVIEAIPEREDIKRSFYEELAKSSDESTIFCTNSSTMLPSTFADATGRPDRFCALHFANRVWTNNTGEIMPHPGTSKETFETVTAFAKDIGLVALPLRKEQPGYILNSLLVPFLDSAMSLVVNDVADPESIDLTWTKATGAPLGPCRILDIVGITTAYNITMNKAEKGHEESQKIAKYLKEHYIDKNRLGVATGEGFFDYSHLQDIDDLLHDSTESKSAKDDR